MSELALAGIAMARRADCMFAPRLQASPWGQGDAGPAQPLTVDGDRAKLAELLGLLDSDDPAFPLVTP